MYKSKGGYPLAGLIAMALAGQPWRAHAQIGEPPPLVVPALPQLPARPGAPSLDPPQASGPLAPQQTLSPPAPQPELPPLQPPQKLAPLLAQLDAPLDTVPSDPPASDANRLDTPDQTSQKAGEVIEGVTKGDVKALRRGPLLLHGNFCGIGSRPGHGPVDALDAACERHDNCTKDGELPSCACDGRLQREATAVVDDPASTPDLKTLAAAVAASMAVLICK